MRKPTENALERFGRMKMTKSGFFPIFLDIRNANIVFFGGGFIANRRVNVMSCFDTNLIVVAPEITENLQEMKEANEITHISDSFDEKYLVNANIVIACTDDNDLNHRIYECCRERGIMVNNCSNHDECDFYFPGVGQKDNVVVGINAGGHAHRQAKEIREKIEEILDERQDCYRK